MLEVRASGELGDAPAGELAGEPAAKVLAEHFAGGALQGGGGLGTVEVEEGDEAGAAAELLDDEGEARGPLLVGRGDAACERTRFVPRLHE